MFSDRVHDNFYAVYRIWRFVNPYFIILKIKIQNKLILIENFQIKFEMVLLFPRQVSHL